MTENRSASPRSSLRAGDVLGVGSLGLTTRKLRTALSALGISIGIGALVAVLGLSASSRAELDDQISALGTNLLTVQAGSGFGAGDATLSDDAPAAIGRIAPVRQAAAVSSVDDSVLRSDLVNSNETGGLSVVAAEIGVLDALRGEVADGEWLTEQRAATTSVVLGSVAAERLGVPYVDGTMVYIGDEWFTVSGILEPFPLAPDIDRAALIGVDAAVNILGSDYAPGTIYVRTDPDFLDDVRAVLPLTADPASPEEVEVSRPSDVLEAQAAADNTLTTLFLGLGAVALVVGGVGIANVMVIAVIERRSEIGLRRALGATEAHIRRQFLTESLLLSTLGGLAGVVLGGLATSLYAISQGWDVVLPVAAASGGVLASLAVGAIAGIYPAIRASKLSPTEALRS